jgi:uncharacterized RDD family membrane protein YckC
MSRRARIVTPENIEISYEIAGIGSRFAASFIDHTLQIVLILLITLAASLASGSMSALGSVFEAGASSYIKAITGLIVFAVIFGYFSVFELAWSGRTPGKRALGLRVVRDGGYPIDIYSSLVRNLVRIADIIPGPYGIGLVSVFVSSDYKRLGDYAAGTIVIKERQGTEPQELRRRPASPSVAYFMHLIKNLDMLTTEDYQILRRFTERRYQFEISVQAYLGMRLALPLIQRMALEVPIKAQLHYADVVEAIERRYVGDRGIVNSPISITDR